MYASAHASAYADLLSWRTGLFPHKENGQFQANAGVPEHSQYEMTTLSQAPLTMSSVHSRGRSNLDARTGRTFSHPK